MYIFYYRSGKKEEWNLDRVGNHAWRFYCGIKDITVNAHTWEAGVEKLKERLPKLMRVGYKNKGDKL